MSTESPCHQKSPETCIPMCGAALGCKPQQDYEQPLSQQNPRDVMLRTTEYYDALESTPRKINMEHNHGGLEDHFPF